MLQVFSKEWFDRHQVKLVRFANTSIGRAVFGIPNVPVIGISPGGYSFIKGVNLKEQRLVCGCYSASKDIYSKRLRKYGAPFWWTLHAFDTMVLDHQRLIPNFGFYTLTKYLGTTGHAAYMSRLGVEAWATKRSGVGTHCVASYEARVGISCSSGGLYTTLHRTGMGFDTSSIYDTAVVDSADFYIYANYTQTNIVGANHYLVLVNPDPVSLSWAASDYQRFTTTLYSGSFPFSGYSCWYSTALTATGLAAINKTWYTIIGIRHYDDWNDSPAWTENQTDQIVIPDDLEYFPSLLPYLYITYSVPVKVNISDVWRDVVDIQINIGDSWRTLSSLNINIGDVWKVVF